MKDVVIVGGGTAGWLTALLTKQMYPHYNIVLIESSEIGILGAGEGTTPHFPSVMEMLGIPLIDLVKECKATVKTGIKFTNWNGDGSSYFHSFSPMHELSFNACDSRLIRTVIPTKQVADGKNLDDISFYKKLADQFKVPFVYADGEFSQFGNYAVHFDARLLADYLSKLAQTRGVTRVDGVVDEFIGEQNITSIKLKDGSEVSCDFVFDCTGFARLLIGKRFNSEWVSYKKHMPLDTGLPFFIPHDDINLIPYTEAIAMKYGWVWKIPVKGRYGCGYVFDSSYITKEEALAEAEKYFGMKLESPRTFKFDAGTYKDIYINNCLAIGLSAGFIEPLEATSIMISCTNLISFLVDDGINNQNKAFVDSFNNECYARNHEVLQFLYMHYLTERNDSPFWKEFRTKTVMVDGLQAKLDRWAVTAPTYKDVINNALWGIPSILQVGVGSRVLNRAPFMEKANNQLFDDELDGYIKNAMLNQTNAMNKCLTHQEFLTLLNNK